MRSQSDTQDMGEPDERRVAFFDLDRTVISVNSGSAWVSSEYKGGHISGWQLARALWWITRYKLGWAELEEPLRYGIQALKGQSEREMVARVTRFFEEMAEHIRPRAAEVIRAHQDRGERCVLITTSSLYLARHFGEQLGLTDVIGSRFEVRGGRFTGEPEGPLCFGVGKVKLAERYARGHGVALSACSFYSDSFSDLPLLEAVGSPFVVTPDRLLRRAAQSRAWPILQW